MDSRYFVSPVLLKACRSLEAVNGHCPGCFFWCDSSPLVLLAAIAIKIESPGGPVLFRQERVGQGGKVFELLKLTMIPNAEMLTGPVLAEENDSRITRVGKVQGRVVLMSFRNFGMY